MKNITQKIQHELELADIQINGNRPWDIQVHDDRLFGQIVRKGSLGLGEAYMNGWWEAEALDQFFAKVLTAKVDQNISITPADALEYAKAVLTNPQNKEKALCCGMGGGNMWYEVHEGKDLVENRLEHVGDTQVYKLATSCSFCMINFNSGKGKVKSTQELQVEDVASILSKSVE